MVSNRYYSHLQKRRIYHILMSSVNTHYHLAVATSNLKEDHGATFGVK